VFLLIFNFSRQVYYTYIGSNIANGGLAFLGSSVGDPSEPLTFNVRSDVELDLPCPYLLFLSEETARCPEALCGTPK
jgi:hypothetical protein